MDIFVYGCSSKGHGASAQSETIYIVKWRLLIRDDG